MKTLLIIKLNSAVSVWVSLVISCKQGLFQGFHICWDNGDAEDILLH